VPTLAMLSSLSQELRVKLGGMPRGDLRKGEEALLFGSQGYSCYLIKTTPELCLEHLGNCPDFHKFLT
jgi:hypothetical protein